MYNTLEMVKDDKVNTAVGLDEVVGQFNVKAIRYVDADAHRLLEPILSETNGQSSLKCTLVKQGISRSIYRCQCQTDQAGIRVFYLKKFHSPTLIHRLQRLLGLSDSRNEMRFGEYLLQKGIPVPKVLARYCRNGSDWLIMEAIEPSVPADKWFEEQLAKGNYAAIRAANIALARHIGRMHACGVIHRDPHCGNILIRLPSRDAAGEHRNDNANNGGFEGLVIMDLHRMRYRRHLSRRSKAANLAQLYQDRRYWLSRTEQLRFLKHYLQASGAGGSLRGWVELIEMLARAHRRRLNAQRDRRIFKTNRYFTPISVSGYRGHVVLASKRYVPGSVAYHHVFTVEDWRKVLDNPESLFTGDDVEVVKDSASSLVVRRTIRLGDVNLRVFIKRARRKRFVRLFFDLFRRSRALRAFYLGHALLGRHIYTALPLAAIEKRRWGFLTDSILITEQVEGLHLNKFLNRYLKDSNNGEVSVNLPESARKRLAQQVLWQLGRLLRRLHEEKFAHRDLKASNVLVHWNGALDQPPQLILVDLDGVKKVMRVTSRMQFRGLMRLNVSLLECPVVNHAGRLRMLLGYLRRPGVGRINFKPYWRVLERWSERKIRKQIASRQKKQKRQRRMNR